MSVIVFSSLLFATSVAAGPLGALTGLGGGVVIVPALVLLFGVDSVLSMPPASLESLDQALQRL